MDKTFCLMDPKTASFYTRTAIETCKRYEQVASPLEGIFDELLDTPSKVLDVGAGSGRDMALLCAKGHDLFGIEPSEAMRIEALKYHPMLRGRLIEGKLPGLPAQWTESFDLVSCCAVLMHIPETSLKEAISDLVRCIKPGGKLLLSTPKTRVGLDSEFRDKEGRLFEPYCADELSLRFTSLHLIEIKGMVSDDAMGRLGVSWNTQVFLKPT